MHLHNYSKTPHSLGHEGNSSSDGKLSRSAYILCLRGECDSDGKEESLEHFARMLVVEERVAKEMLLYTLVFNTLQ